MKTGLRDKQIDLKALGISQSLFFAQIVPLPMKKMKNAGRVKITVCEGKNYHSRVTQKHTQLLAKMQKLPISEITLLYPENSAFLKSVV